MRTFPCEHKLRMLLRKHHFIAFLGGLLIAQKGFICPLDLLPQGIGSALLALPSAICLLVQLQNGFMGKILENKSGGGFAWQRKRQGNREGAVKPLEKPAECRVAQTPWQRACWLQSDFRCTRLLKQRTIRSVGASCFRVQQRHKMQRRLPESASGA